jgi:hypothetical protein
MKPLAKYVYGMCIVIMMISCRTKKPVVTIDDTVKTIMETSHPEAIFNAGHTFHTMKLKRMDIDFNINGITDSFKGNMAIIRDSLIVISVIPVLGYEAVRIMCTQDSIVVINRRDKTYKIAGIGEYMKRYNMPAGFDNLQAVIANEVFYYGKGTGERNIEKWVKTDSGQIAYIIETSLGNTKKANQQIIADRECYRIKDINIIDYQRKIRLDIEYADFEKYEKVYFPGKISIGIQDRRNSIKLDVEYGQVIFDEPVNVIIETPKDYSKTHM